MSGPPVRVIFIGGYARTGSTLLDRLLGQIDGFVSLGEIRHVWERSFLEDQLCGCGRPFRSCPFWTEVADRAFGGLERVPARALSELKFTVGAFRNLPRSMTGGWTRSYHGRLGAYRSAVETLYRAARDVASADVLIDSSKDVQHAYLLARTPGIDLRFLHLVRDSRAVAYSWRRRRRRPEVVSEALDMPRFPVVRSAMAWDTANAVGEAIRLLGRPYARVRYEDLVDEPAGRITEALDRLGIGGHELGFLDGRTATLGVAHTVAGNPMRFRTGRVEIESDEEWRRRMPEASRALVTAMTAPLLVRYRYPVRAPRRLGPTPREMSRTLRQAFDHDRDPAAFDRSIAELTVRYLRGHGVEPAGGRWLDVGTGGGEVARGLREAGAEVVALDVADRRGERGLTPFVLGDAARLPFADATFDGVLSSNVLEHVPDGHRMLEELLRVCRPGGTVYLAWTNWLSPFGGHDWSPFHYLGPRLGPRAFRAVTGRAPRLVPGERLFPVHVGQTLRWLRSRPVAILDVAPRYWPAFRGLASVPALREMVLWNCVVLMRRTSDEDGPGWRA